MSGLLEAGGDDLKHLFQELSLGDPCMNTHYSGFLKPSLGSSLQYKEQLHFS